LYGEAYGTDQPFRRGAQTLRGWHLGTIAGIAVEINISWVFIFAYLVARFGGGYFPERFPQAATWEQWLAGTIGSLLLFASVLVHEVAHSLIAGRYGMKVSRITLFVFGGVAQSEGEPKTAISEFWIAIAGPVASVLIGAVSYGLAWLLGLGISLGVWGGVLALNGWLNIGLAVFNMLPAFPLDGGRVLRAIIWHIWGDLLRATAIATFLGRAFGYFLAGGGLLLLIFKADLFGIVYLGIGWLLLASATSAFESAKIQAALAGKTVAELMMPARLFVEATWPVDYVLEAYLRPYRAGILPVLHEGRVVGVLHSGTVDAVDPGNRPYVPVHQLMDPIDPDATIGADAAAMEAVRLLVGKGKGYLLVTDDQGLVGAISETDLSAALARS